MRKEEFVQNLGISCYNGLYHFSYREKSVMQYIEEVERNSGEPEVNEECVDYFLEEVANVPDGFDVNIIMLGRMFDTGKPIYSINLTNDKGVLFNRLFDYDFLNDKTIDIVINSLCKTMCLKHYRMVKVKFIVLWNENEFEKFYNDYLEETKEVE